MNRVCYLLSAVAVTFTISFHPDNSYSNSTEWTYRNLALKDYTHIKMMTDKLVRSDNATDKDRIEALTVLLSRKDNDGTRGKLFLPIFSDLESPSESLKLLLEAAIEKSADKTLTNELRATQFVIIGNLMDELIKNAPKESQFLFEIIRDKSLKADGRVAGYMELNGLKKDTQPSQRARKLLAPPEAAD